MKKIKVISVPRANEYPGMYGSQERNLYNQLHGYRDGGGVPSNSVPRRYNPVPPLNPSDYVTQVKYPSLFERPIPWTQEGEDMMDKRTTDIFVGEGLRNAAPQSYPVDKRTLTPVLPDRYSDYSYLNKPSQTEVHEYKHGGYIPRMGDGGDPGTYITHDPNDPRIQSYNDSAKLYNNYLELTKALKDQGYIDERNQPHAHEFGPIQWGEGTNSRDRQDLNNLYNNPKRWEFDKATVRQAPLSISGLSQDGAMSQVNDFIIGTINKSLPKQLFSDKINPKGVVSYEKEIKPNDPNINQIYENKEGKLVPSKGGIDKRHVADYSNVRPVQGVRYEPLPPQSQTKKVKTPVAKKSVPQPVAPVPPPTAPEKKVNWQYIREDNNGIRKSDTTSTPVTPDWFYGSKKNGGWLNNYKTK